MEIASESIYILHVDDDPDFLEVVKTFLEREGERFSIDTATSASQGLDRVASDHYDCIVSDYDMPGLNGVEFLQTVRNRYPDLPFILYTGKGSEEVASEAISAGVTDYLQKATATNQYDILADRITNAVDASHSAAEAERRRRRLERFVDVVSHDLRNPLTVAQGSLELARDDCESGHIETAADAVDRSLELIVNLLELARQGKTVREVEPVDLRTAIDRSWSNVKTDETTLTTDIEVTIQSDPGRLKQLLENLFSNGVKHAGADVKMVVGRIDPVYTATRAGGILPNGFYVADDGPGIPERERDRVFETGYTTHENGTGFGLNIAKEIANAHGWDINVTESKDGGARFEITGVEMI